MVKQADELNKRIIDMLRRSNEPLTPQEVAKELGVSWSTVQTRLYQFALEGNAKYARKGRVNIFWAEGGEFRIDFPIGVKAMDLESLARVNDPYWERRLTSAEIVERERRRV